eukprot:6736643-Prymnesium_polylepis.1
MTCPKTNTPRGRDVYRFHLRKSRSIFYMSMSPDGPDRMRALLSTPKHALYFPDARVSLQPRCGAVECGRMVPRGLSARAAANIATQDARLANRMPSDLTYKAEAGLGHVCADRRYTRGSQALFTSSVTRYLNTRLTAVYKLCNKANLLYLRFVTTLV